MCVKIVAKSDMVKSFQLLGIKVKSNEKTVENFVKYTWLSLS